MKAKFLSLIAAVTMVSAPLALAPAAHATTTTRDAINLVAPDYPRSAERRGIEGSVQVRYDIAADGSVENIEVVETTHPGIFDRAALRAVESWRYEAAAERTEGHTFTLEFSLS
ncbi:energy transducer TonB [Maricaulis sp.]|uniref:energy transducer TonB n=1 Tax=Maricaulis sp. TaxID=1486257 RepID=UPI00260399ED|nr:energy transducer TonB [Maricaulis sp.]